MTTTASSAEFQRQTGYLAAQEIHEDDPGIDLYECVGIVAIELARLGEAELTRSELDGMQNFYILLACTGVSDAA